MAIATATPSLLLETVTTTPTEFWNDSCAAAELEDAIAQGATGGTSNPVLVLDALRLEPEPWERRIREVAAAMPTTSDTEVAWRIAEEMAIRAASLLEPVFERTEGRRGRISIQVDPARYRDTEAMLVQATRFHQLAPNIQVKLPVTTAGLAAIEEATARGIPINATVNTTVAGALAVGAAVERGFERRSAAGLDVDAIHPVCTLMIGRLEDWLKVVNGRDGVLLTPGRVEWAGIAVFKRAYAIYRERGYRTRLLSGAFRNHLPWSQLIGGDIVITIPPAWQRQLNGSGIEVRPRIDEPVDPAIVAELLDAVPDFRLAYEPDGLSTDELEGYGATARTLRTFIAATHDLAARIRDVMLPDPDVAR
jgi:transaldolase